MGASGAGYDLNIFKLKKKIFLYFIYFFKGKTTLLNVLTCRNRGNLKITGNVKVNGKFIQDPSDLAAISGYIQQDDIFIGTLKVKEHLKFQVKSFLSNILNKYKISLI
jgi:ABC-type multidrug transport system ATPase subunit